MYDKDFWATGFLLAMLMLLVCLLGVVLGVLVAQKKYEAAGARDAMEAPLERRAGAARGCCCCCGMGQREPGPGPGGVAGETPSLRQGAGPPR